MTRETELLEKRVDKLEETIVDNQKQVTADVKAMGAELKAVIEQEFKRCREIMPLTCPVGKNKISLTHAAGLCTVIIGIFLTLAKLGLLTGLV